jgi:hypothetical protein
MVDMKEKLRIAPLSMTKTGLKKDALAGDVAVVTGGAGNVGVDCRCHPGRRNIR